MHVPKLARLALDPLLVLEELVQVDVGLDRRVPLDVVRQLLAFEFAHVLSHVLVTVPLRALAFLI